MLSSPALTPDTVVDITHESVIRKWKRLKAWVREGSRSSRVVRRPVARRRPLPNGAAGLWQDPGAAGDSAATARGGLERGVGESVSARRRSAVRRGRCRSSTESERTGQAAAQEEEQRDRELRQAQALARSKRIQSIGLASLLVLVVIAALMQSRVLSKDRQMAQAAADRQRLTSDNQRIASQLPSLEAARTEHWKSAAPNTAPGDEGGISRSCSS